MDVVRGYACATCHTQVYHTGCTANGCTGMRCPRCAAGCDLDNRNGRCATALALETPDEFVARLDTERAALGLPPLDHHDDKGDDHDGT